MKKIIQPQVNQNGFPLPLKAKCFKCRKPFYIKYVVPNKSYSKKNNWEYWTNPQWKKPNSKDRQICNACLLAFYYNKKTYWATIKDLKKRQQLRKYIYDGTIAYNYPKNYNMETQNQRPSILKGEKRFELDERTKKAFSEFVKKSKQHKFDPNKHNQTIICGPEEFAETEKKAKE